jgi:saccharopine dehydrogenase-like NADP-dependent oxidoreductase
MKNLLIIGGGKIGVAMAHMLSPAAGVNDYKVTVADIQPVRDLPASATYKHVDVADARSLAAVFEGQHAVISAAPYFLNTRIAEAAKAAGTHYLDLTEDVATTTAIRALAKDANTAFIPQCGLAPGAIGIVAHGVASSFEKLRAINMRVGALPRFPSNRLKYSLTWSTDGLINEYCNPCQAVQDGELVWLRPLEGLEHITLEGAEYEAFNTSGGLGTLCETLSGKVEVLTYKTIRYPGHCDIMKLLLEDLRMKDDRATLKRVMENAVPTTSQDVVLFYVEVSGERDGKLVQETFLRAIDGQDGVAGTAIQRTTAAGVLAMLDMLFAGRLPQKGFVRQEDAKMSEFLANRFGKIYA